MELEYWDDGVMKNLMIRYGGIGFTQEKNLPQRLSRIAR